MEGVVAIPYSLGLRFSRKKEGREMKVVVILLFLIFLVIVFPQIERIEDFVDKTLTPRRTKKK